MYTTKFKQSESSDHLYYYDSDTMMLHQLSYKDYLMCKSNPDTVFKYKIKVTDENNANFYVGYMQHKDATTWNTKEAVVEYVKAIAHQRSMRNMPEHKFEIQDFVEDV